MSLFATCRHGTHRYSTTADPQQKNKKDSLFLLIGNLLGAQLQLCKTQESANQIPMFNVKRPLGNGHSRLYSARLTMPSETENLSNSKSCSSKYQLENRPKPNSIYPACGTHYNTNVSPIKKPKRFYCFFPHM